MDDASIAVENLAPALRRAALEAVQRGRRSVRSYRPQSVPRELIESALAAATWAPSPHHSAPWRFVVLTRPEVKAALARAMGEVWQADLQSDGVPEARIARILARSVQRIGGAPVVLLLCVTEERQDRYPDARRQQAEQLMFAHSVGAALQNLMLAAHAHSLATCWMCAPLFCPDTVVTCLGLDPALRPQALLTLGYPVDQPPPHERRSVADLVALWD
jgi:coenzyme F420-0:L-glutamate ligase/coenzyme F420-1:gamma-L-glutamate ligase